MIPSFYYFPYNHFEWQPVVQRKKNASACTFFYYYSIIRCFRCDYVQTKWRCSTIFLTRNLIIKDCSRYFIKRKCSMHFILFFFLSFLRVFFILINLLTGLYPHAHDFVTDKWSTLIDKLFFYIASIFAHTIRWFFLHCSSHVWH